MSKPVTLYQHPASFFCSKVRITLREKGVAFEMPPIPGGWTRSPEFLALNPAGKIPLLVTDTGELIGESEVIAEYLEDRYPEPALLPRDPMERARSRWFSRFHDLQVAPIIAQLFHAPADAGPEAMVRDVERLHETLKTVEGRLGGGPFFLGERFSLCDAAFALSLWYAQRYAARWDRPLDRARYPKLLRCFDNIVARPSVAEVLRDAQAACGR